MRLDELGTCFRAIVLQRIAHMHAKCKMYYNYCYSMFIYTVVAGFNESRGTE